MRSPKNIATHLIISTSVIVALLGSLRPFPQPAMADTRIRGEFEYNLDEQTLSQWEIGPIFSLEDDLDLEIPIGQMETLLLLRTLRTPGKRFFPPAPNMAWDRRTFIPLKMPEQPSKGKFP